MLERHGESASILRSIATAGIDYVRWTQLVPMVTVWVFMVLMAVAMLFVTFQTESMTLMQELQLRYPELTERIAGWAGNPALANTHDSGAPEGSLHFSDEDIMPFVLKAWAVLALVGSLLGALRNRIFGPKPPTPLLRKLLLAALFAALCSGAFFAAYHFGGEHFNDGLSSWLPLFVGIPLFAWVVSVYSLGVSHLLGRLNRWIEAG
jgi:hypothetical protein